MTAATNPALCITFAVTAYVTLNLGLVLQKRGASQIPAIEEAGLVASVKSFFKSPPWLVGFILVNVQMVPLWVAFSYGPISLVTPMIGVGLVTLVLFSRFYLHEPVTPRMTLGVVVTIAGLVVFGAASSQPSTQPSWPETLALVTAPGALVWLTGLLACAVVPATACFVSGFRAADVLFGLSSGAAAGLGMVMAKLMMADLDTTATGALGARLAQWPFYVFFLFMIVGNAGSMVLQQFGFQKGQAVILAPIFMVGTVLFSAITGIVLFGEWDHDSTSVIITKVASMATISIGVVLLAYRRGE